VTKEIVVRLRIEPDEPSLPEERREDTPEQIEPLILDGDQTLEEAGYGHGV
jgi:hypothetical protein